MEANCKIAIVTAFLGNGGSSGPLSFSADAQKELSEAGVDVFSFTDADLDLILPFENPAMCKDDIIDDSISRRIKSWHFKNKYSQSIYPSFEDKRNRLLAKIPKMLFYKLIPSGYDYVVWLDSKFTVYAHWYDYLLWLIESHPGYDIITSKHCERGSVKEEVDFMFKHMDKNMMQKYDLAEIALQYDDYRHSCLKNDDKLYELTMIIYSKSILDKQAFCEEWYAHNVFYSIQDQVSFPYLVNKYGIKVFDVQQCVFEMPFVSHEYSRK